LRIDFGLASQTKSFQSFITGDIPKYGLITMDGVNAQFSPPKEQLAFSIHSTSEVNLPEIWSEPLPVVVSVFNKYKTYQDVYDNLPDIELVLSLNT
jgi:hypothetical protein